MTKFEEEVDKVAKQAGYESLSLLIGDCEEANKIYIHFKNWHSDEEFQEKATKLTFAEEEIEELGDKIGQLKSQLQQQALPVVPECVDKTVELLKKNPETLWSKLYSSLGEEGVDWLNEFQHKDERFGIGGLNHKLFVLFHLAINGYTVEKQQLFYLKHIDFCKTDKHYDWFTIKHSDGPLNHLRVEKGEKPSTIDCKFTQKEIDSMQTGSYEQIEVEK